MFIQKFTFTIIFFFSLLTTINAQEGPQPPPVDVGFTLMNNPKVGEDAEVRLKVTPREDMHLDIRILIPEGLETKYEDGFQIERDKNLIMEPVSDEKYNQIITFYVGPVKEGETTEYISHLKILKQQKQKLILQIQDLMKYGFKQEIFEIGQE